MLGTEGQQQLQAQAHTQPPLDKSVTVPVLVCETSRELQSYSELFVEPASLRFGPSGDSGPVTVSGVAAGAAAGSAEEGAHPTYRSCEWEVVLDAWLEAQTDALDFLQGFIN